MINNNLKILIKSHQNKNQINKFKNQLKDKLFRENKKKVLHFKLNQNKFKHQDNNYKKEKTHQKLQVKPILRQINKLI